MLTYNNIYLLSMSIRFRNKAAEIAVLFRLIKNNLALSQRKTAQVQFWTFELWNIFCLFLLDTVQHIAKKGKGFNLIYMKIIIRITSP